MPKAHTALEATVDQHTKDIDSIQVTMQEMVKQITGLRADMSERGTQMITTLNTQNTLLVKNQTDHEANDIKRFGDLNTRLAYYVGGGMMLSAIISICVAVGGAYWGAKH